MYFPSQNRSGLLIKEHLYSTSVVIVTINGGMDDTDIGRFGLFRIGSQGLSESIYSLKNDHLIYDSVH